MTKEHTSTLVASIDKQRQKIVSLISFDATLSTIDEIKAPVKALSDIFKQYGITQLGKQLQGLRYEQCTSTSPVERERLSRECYVTVHTLRRKKHEHRKRIKEEGAALKLLYAQLFDELYTHSKLSEVYQECKKVVSMLQELATYDPCALYQVRDELDALECVEPLSLYETVYEQDRGITLVNLCTLTPKDRINLPSFFYRLAILSLFSTDALVRAYEAEQIKVRKSLYNQLLAELLANSKQ
jgi:hypothetical protein